MISALYSIYKVCFGYVGLEPIKALIWKGMILFLLTIVLPIILNNFFHHIVQTIINTVNAQLGEFSLSSSLQFTGATAYLATLLKIPQGVSLLLGAVSTRFALRLVRMG